MQVIEPKTKRVVCVIKQTLYEYCYFTEKKRNKVLTFDFTT